MMRSERKQELKQLVVLVLVMLCCMQISVGVLCTEQEVFTQFEVMDGVMKDTRARLLEVSNALVELNASIQALNDSKSPDLASIVKLKKEHVEEMLSVQTILQQQMKAYEEKVGYKAGCASCALIASQSKTSMKEGQYYIYPAEKAIRVRCKHVNGVWTALSVLGSATKPDVVIGPKSTTGVYSADGETVAISVDGKETMTTNANGLKVNGKVEAGGLIISGAPLFQKVFKFNVRSNFIKGEWFPIVAGNVSPNLPLGSYVCRTHWDFEQGGYWVMSHTYLLSWIDHTNSQVLAPFPLASSSATHEADLTSMDFRFRPRTGHVAPAVEMRISATSASKQNGKDVMFHTQCLQVFSDDISE